MLPKIGIVILNWNNWQETIACISQIHDLEYPQELLEVYIVDNGSTDDSVQELSCIQEVFFIPLERNLGFAAGNNVGMKAAFESNCQYLLLLNNDTILENDFLKNLTSGFNGFPEPGIISPKIYYANPNNLIWFAGGIFNKPRILGTMRGIDQTDNGDFNQPGRIDFAVGCCMLIHRKVINDIGYLDEAYFFYNEDVDYSLRCQEAGHIIWYQPDAVIYHKVSQSTQDNIPLRVELNTQARIVFFFKHIHGIAIPIVVLLELVRFFRRSISFIGKKEPKLISSYLKGAWEGINISLSHKSLDNQSNGETNPKKVSSKLWSLFWRISGTAFFLFILTVLIIKAASGIRSFLQSGVQLKTEFLFLSVLLHISGYLIAAWVWSDIIHKLGVKSYYLFDLMAFSVSAIARKVPGLVFYAVSRILIYSVIKASKAIISIAMLVELAMMTLAGLVCLLFISYSQLFPIKWINSPYVIALAFLIVIFGVSLIGPRMINFFIRLTQRRSSVDSTNEKISVSYIDTLKWLLGESLVVLLSSGVVYCVIKALDVNTTIPFNAVFASYSLTITLGPISIWLPGDIGLRDGFMYLFTKPWTDPAFAALATLVVRLWISVFEILFGLVAGIFLSKKINFKDLKQQR